MMHRGSYTCDHCGRECHPARVDAVTISVIDKHGCHEIANEWHLCERCAPIITACISNDIKGGR